MAHIGTTTMKKDLGRDLRKNTLGREVIRSDEKRSDEMRGEVTI
jgi:hypothetical protein